jgi:uncharacterized protein YkwD
MRRARTLIPATIVLTFALALPPAAPARIDDAERHMAQAVNDFRRAHGRSGVRMSHSLMRSSARYSNFLMRNDVFGHASRIRASRRFRRLGEVLELHSGRQPQVERALRRWANSPGHRAALLHRRFRWVGAGRSVGRWRGRRMTIWTVQLGSRR